MASFNFTSKKYPHEATINVVRKSCKNPPIKTCLRIRIKSLRENSIPIEKSNKTTPNSAKTSIFDSALTKLRISGPARIPVKRKPRIVGILNELQINKTKIARTKMIPTSNKTGGMAFNKNIGTMLQN